MVLFLLFGFISRMAYAHDIPAKQLQRPLAISIDEGYAPQTFLDANGQPVGIFIDVWRLWSQKTGINITFIPGNWNDSIENLKNGKADIHSGLFYSDSRAEWIGFSRSFYGVGSYPFFLKDSEKIDPKKNKTAYDFVKNELGKVNIVLVYWAIRKYKGLKRHKAKSLDWLGRCAKTRPDLFYHWKMGLRPMA